jgi:zinc protease
VKYLLFLIGSLSLYSQELNLQYPPLKPVKLPDVQISTLPNGMKLYLLENHSLPLVTGFALVRTGNLFDPQSKIGLAGITGAVMRTGGTASKTGDQIDEQLENVAASVESGIGESSGSVSFNTLKANTAEVLAVFKEILTAPAFRQDKLDLAKSQTSSGIARRNDDPGGIAGREFASILYGRTSPYGWSMEYEHVGRIQREDLVEFHKRYFFPANIMLAVQGDFNAAEMKAMIEKLFAGWTVTQPPVPAFPKVDNKAKAGVYFAEKPDVAQTFFEIGHLGGILNDKDYPALEVMGDILGGGFSSRLFRKVRTEKGYAYSISADWGADYDHPGMFTITGSTNSVTTTETIQLVQEEVARIRADEVTDRELKTAKDKVLNSFVFNFDRPTKTLTRIVNYGYYGYPAEFIFNYQQAVAAVTKADILRVAKERLKPEDIVIVAVGKSSDFGKPLADLKVPLTPIDLTIPQAKQEAAKADSASLAKGVELLKKGQQAMGGAEKLAAVKDYVYTAEMEMQAGPQGVMKGKQKNMWLAPSGFRQEQDMPFGKIIAAYDGQSGFLVTPQGAAAMPPPVISQVQGELFRTMYPLLLSDRDATRKVNYVSVGVVEVSAADGKIAKLEFDESTGALKKLSYVQEQMGGAPQNVDETFSDWRVVSGVKVPYLIVTMQGGNKFAELKVQDYKINTGLTVQELTSRP